MEKIIFFALAIPILGFVFYLGGSAIMKGFKAKVDNRPIKPEETGTDSETVIRPSNSNNLSSEISKLNELYENGALTQEEFEKAKSKLLNN
ncbi:SHOCT domain-containing protein [Candidatus Pelagibacter sp.]|uniref:SHOCT domain-containing protein n=1 Tax=Candidatus Pelagibacter sp. TaxID=2024849 RepID=UPI003F846EC2